MTALANRARSLLDKVSVAETQPQAIGRLVAFDGVMLEATGLSLPVGSGVRIGCNGQQDAFGEIIGFRNDHTLLMATGGSAQPSCGAPVTFDSHASEADVGPALLGRIIDASGEPLDGHGAIQTGESWPLGGKCVNPLQTGRVTEAFDVGVRAINALLSCGVGQRVAIIAGSGVGKSVLMGQIIAGASADIIVVGLIGERSREVTDFVEKNMAGAVKRRCVVVAVPADHAPLLRLRAAMRATAIAEYFRSRGKRVLLVIDSLTRIAHAQRELGLSLGEPATMKGYPPSALGLIPRLVERSGADRATGGSITAFYTVLADGDDPNDPVVDAARSIVDGHIVLSRSMAEQAIFPAIDLGKSISRVMHDIASQNHRKAASRLRNYWTHYEENRDLILMGAYVAGSDSDLDAAIARRPEITAFLKQDTAQNVDFNKSVAQLEKGFAV
ncbi:MAG: FliI/YscN family ATPase [Sphingopyxis sp.]